MLSRRVAEIAALALLLLLGLARAASAQVAEQVSIHWHPRAACARPAALERQVARLVGPTIQQMEPLFADVHVHATKQRTYLLDLRVEGLAEQTERRVEVASCAEIERAAALLISTAVQTAALASVHDPLSLETRSSILPAPSTPDTEQTEDAPEAPPEARPLRDDRTSLPPTRPPISFWLRLGATSDTRALPGMTAGPNMGVGLHVRGLQTWVDGRYLFARERGDPASALLAELDMFAVALGAAYLSDLGPVALGPMAEAEVGLLRAHVLGERDGGNARATWTALLPGVRVAARLRDHLGLALDACLGVPLSRPRFTLEDRMLHHTPTVTLRVALALSVRLGSK